MDHPSTLLFYRLRWRKILGAIAELSISSKPCVLWFGILLLFFSFSLSSLETIVFLDSGEQLEPSYITGATCPYPLYSLWRVYLMNLWVTWVVQMLYFLVFAKRVANNNTRQAYAHNNNNHDDDVDEDEEAEHSKRTQDNRVTEQKCTVLYMSMLLFLVMIPNIALLTIMSYSVYEAHTRHVLFPLCIESYNLTRLFVTILVLEWIHTLLKFVYLCFSVSILIVFLVGMIRICYVLWYRN